MRRIKRQPEKHFFAFRIAIPQCGEMEDNAVMVNFDLKGKRVVLTGGATGLGSGMAEGFVKEGASLAIIDISARLEETAEKLSRFGTVYGIKADISTAENREKAFKEAISKLGGVDVLVNCAGIQKRHFSEEFPLDDWDKVIGINLTAVFHICQLAGREMLKNGKGKIINVASMLSFFGGYTVPAYAASKGGVAQLTKALSNEWALKGINVNAIAPGYMATEMNTAIINDETRNAQITARIPAKRWGTPDDVKGAVLFLASEASDYISGAIIPVDGGYLSC